MPKLGTVHPITPDLIRQLLLKLGLLLICDVVAEHGVEPDEELSCDGDEGDLHWFSGLAHLLVSLAEMGTVSLCREGGDVEGFADASSSAAD